MTAQTYIEAAMRLIGAIDPGETTPSSELDSGLAALNSMIDAWASDHATVYAITATNVSLASGTAAYTLTRPVHIESAVVSMAAPGGGTALVKPVQVMNAMQWASVDKTMTAAFPQAMYCDYNSPTSAILVAPTPNGTRTLTLYTWKALAKFDALDTDLTLPPAYEKAIKFNLAVDISAEFGMAPTDAVLKGAADSYMALKHVNFPQPPAA